MARPMNITISVRFSREQLAYMHEALKMNGIIPSNLSDMIRQAIGGFVNFTDPNLFKREASLVSYNAVDLMTGNKDKAPERGSDPFGMQKTTISQREMIPEQATIIHDPEQHALRTFVGMGKHINTFPKEQRTKAQNLWTYLQEGSGSIKSCLWDANDNREAEFITAHLLNSTGFFSKSDDLRTKYKDRCEEVIANYLKEEESKK